MENKRLLLILLLVFFIMDAYTQNQTKSKEELLCKTWILDKYQEENDKIYPPLPEMKNDYITYNSDGTVVSTESGIKMLGKWSFDEKTSILTTTQTQDKNTPSIVAVKVLKLTEDELIIEGKDSGGSILKMYLKPNK